MDPKKSERKALHVVKALFWEFFEENKETQKTSVGILNVIQDFK
jgi:hypothetical protein